MALGAGGTLGAAAALAANAPFSSPYAASFGVQNAQPLLWGQPPSLGVAAFAQALPIQQQT